MLTTKPPSPPEKRKRRRQTPHPLPASLLSPLQLLPVQPRKGRGRAQVRLETQSPKHPSLPAKLRRTLLMQTTQAAMHPLLVNPRPNQRNHPAHRDPLQPRNKRERSVPIPPASLYRPLSLLMLAVQPRLQHLLQLVLPDARGLSLGWGPANSRLH